MSKMLIGFVLGAILVLVALMYISDVPVGENEVLEGDSIFNIDISGLSQGNPYKYVDGTVIEKADLRLIALPYLAATDVDTTCVAMGGTWIETEYDVGCVGVGPANCNTAAAIAAQTQCIGVHATWYCGLDGIWCKY